MEVIKLGIPLFVVPVHTLVEPVIRFAGERAPQSTGRKCVHAHACAGGLGASLDGVSLCVLLEMTLPSLPPELQDYFRRTKSIKDRPVQPVLCRCKRSLRLYVLQVQVVGC